MKKKNNLSKLDIITSVYSDPERKDLVEIFIDLAILTFYHKGYPGHYFSRYLFKKGIKNIKDYFPNSFFKKLPKLNDEASAPLVRNKLYFDLFYRNFEINTPKILMFNYKNVFISNNKSEVINDFESFKSILETLLVSSLFQDAIIIKKMYESHGGIGIYKIYAHELRDDLQKIKTIFDEVRRASYLFQEVVEQHIVLNKLNASSLNTMRMDTFIDSEGNIEIMTVFIRMSYSNSYLDNVSAGGLLVPINLDSGRLQKYGYKTILRGVNLLTEHPVTKVVFENYEIPFFQESKALVLRAASLIPGLRSVGWDIAISKNGPVLIEGNSNYNPQPNDLVAGGYRSHKIFRKLIEEINQKNIK